MAAAAVAIPLRPSMASFFPRLSAPALAHAFSWIGICPPHVALPPALRSAAFAFPAISINLPSLNDVWEGILRAVPKKKSSYSKTRSRQLAGKALKDVTALCKCPGCGEFKRSHRLCEDCMSKIHRLWAQNGPTGMPGKR